MNRKNKNNSMKKTIIWLTLGLKIVIVSAQEQPGPPVDTILLKPGVSIRDAMQKISNRKEKIRSLKIPTLLITYGFLALDNDNLIALDNSIKKEIREDRPYFRTRIDDYLQYAPALTVYGLNAMGIKGKNNFRDRTMIYLLSNAMMGVTVQSLKKITRIQRPDGFGTNAFPSGHTATAFVAAEFLRQEYKDVSPWYGVAGYMAASATGILRMYNNKHWFRDILPGAGFGILSTKVAYWIYPAIKRKFFKDKPINTLITPYYQSGITGISLLHSFN
jgi:membrane-associated phospholipid phosphatase